MLSNNLKLQSAIKYNIYIIVISFIDLSLILIFNDNKHFVLISSGLLI